MTTEKNLPIPIDTSWSTLYRHIWHFGRGARGKMFLAVFLLTASQLIKLGVPWFAAQAINTVQLAGPDSLNEAGRWIAAIIGTFALSWALHGPGRVLERSVGVRVRQGISDDLYGRLVNAPLAWHDKHHSGEVSHRVAQASGALYDFTQNQFIYLQNAINIIGPLAALWFLSHTTGMLAVVGYLLVAMVVIRFDIALMRLARTENDAERRYTAGLLDFLGNISTVISLRLQQASRKLLGGRLEAVFAPLRRAIVLNEAKWCAVDLLSVSLTWGLVIAYAWQANKTAYGTILIGSVFMIYQYAQQASSVIGAMAANFQAFARIRTNFASAEPLFSAPQPGSGGPTLAEDWTTLRLAGIEYRYQRADGGSAGIQGVHLNMGRSERIALVGGSGSGKSTLLRVLAGLYEAQGGRYEVDGVAQLGLRDLGSISTLIPQEAEVFETTVRSNITFGLPHAAAAIDEALRISAFDAVSDTLPQGLNTPITERGFNLSGGQRQRLALARGVLAAQGSTLLLLDEPTSALDPITEEAVHRRLEEAFPHACIVASVHRMGLLKHFDRVVLMDKGAVVDSGTVEELLERQAMFRELYAGPGGMEEAEAAA
jgi:ABC-type multidrug transport system fused ATPase/permease subunit